MISPETIFGGPLNGILLFVTIVSVPIAVVGSFLILRKFGIEVDRLIHRAGTSDEYYSNGQPIKQQKDQATQTNVKLKETSTDISSDIRFGYNAIRNSKIKTGVIYGLAGVISTATLAGLFAIFEKDGLNVKQTIFLWFILSWPILAIITNIIVYEPHKRIVCIGVGSIVYLAVTLLFSSIGKVLTAWTIFNGIPMVVFWSFGNRRLRTVGPFVLVAVVVAVAGLSVCFYLVLRVFLMLNNGTVSQFALIIACGLAVFVAICGGAWHILKFIGHRYEQKQNSDRMLYFNALWLSFVVWSTIILASSQKGEGWKGILGITAFLVFSGVVKLGFMSFVPIRGMSARRLLFLRVFGNRARSEKIAGFLSHTWRSIGPVMMIGGTDLARANLEPHVLLDFLSGRLRDRYISKPQEIPGRIGAIDTAPDPDFRYRIDEFFCFENTWRPMVQELMKQSDVIVMDARGLNRKHTGCIYELEYLLDHSPWHKFLLVIDSATDTGLVCDIASRRACSGIRTSDKSSRGEELINVVTIENDNVESMGRLLHASLDCV